MIKELPIKTIIVSVATLVLAIVFVVAIVKYAKKAKEFVQEKVQGRELEKEIENNDTSFTPAQLNAYATTLFYAMEGVGTNETKIYNVFSQMKTRSDVLALVKTYGIKDSMNLNQWITSELTSRELKKLNEIIANNGIDYQF